MIADSIGASSRFPSIQLAAGAGESDSKEGNGISFTRRGVKLPQVQRPSVLYRQLFTSKADRSRTEYLLRSGRSSLDLVLDDALRLQKSLPARDRDKLEEYFESFRAVEKRMGANSKPSRRFTRFDFPVDYPQPADRSGQIVDLKPGAKTDSLRNFIPFTDLAKLFSTEGTRFRLSGLSHHGNNPAILICYDPGYIHCFAGF